MATFYVLAIRLCGGGDMPWNRLRGVALWVLFALVVGSAVGLLWVRSGARVERVAAIGRPLPPLRLIDLDRHPVSFDQYRGKRVLAAFILVGCGFCQDQLPVLEKIHQSYADDQLVLVAVSGDDPADAIAFFEKHPVSYPVWVDLRRGFYKKLGKFGVPALFLLDESGILRRAADGYQPFQKVQSMINQFLENGKSPSAQGEPKSPGHSYQAR